MKAIDVLSGHFTQANIEKNFLHNEEEMGRFAQVGRARTLKSYTPPDFIKRLDEIGVDNAMSSANHPHNEITFGYSQRSIKSVVDAVGQEAAVKICSTNIKNFLGV